MADIGRGLKAGIGAGAIMGLLGGIINVVLMFTILHDEYIKIFEQTLAAMPPGAEMTADTLLMISAVTGIIGGLIMGVIFGLIFYISNLLEYLNLSFLFNEYHYIPLFLIFFFISICNYTFFY